MKNRLIFLWLAVLPGISCDNRGAGPAEANDNTIDIPESPSNKGLRPGAIPPPPPPEPQTGEPDSGDRIRKEILELEKATRQIIAAYAFAPRPGVKVDTMDHYFLGSLDQIRQLDCGDARYADLTTFHRSFIDSCKNSSAKTGLEDGQLFCLRSYKTGSNVAAKIAYRRTEGGHSDDDMELISVKANASAIYYLPLYYHFGKEGYDIEIESQLDGNLIRRTIVERYGWSRTTEEGLAQQPRTETQQTFRVQADGTIALLEEKTDHFHIEVN
ncbi:MAG: hypothetical protein H6563_08825 [Lewinellaceae bacterium]|nr:hypothetical protein [Lewinellaceae bacterium]